MATIKSFTSLEQSRKLAEILPLESADMYYTLEDFVDEDTGDVFSIEKVSLGTPSDKEIGCWSLASLIVILPQFIEFKGDKYYLRFMNDYVEYANDEISITGRYLHTTGNDNLVDACVDMIERLHELNLL